MNHENRELLFTTVFQDEEYVTKETVTAKGASSSNTSSTNISKFLAMADRNTVLK